MTEWLRVIGWSLVSLVIAIGLLMAGWLAWSRQKLRRYRWTQEQIVSIQDSQRGRRPLWRDPVEPRK